MAVLMTYHKLVERDSKHVDIQWKATSIILLVLAILTSLAVSLSLQKIIFAFDDQCVLNAELAFTTIPEMNSSTEFEPTIEPSVQPLTSFFNKSFADHLQPNSDREYPVDQIQLLAKTKIDELSKDTKWGEKSSCDFGVYIPICQSCFGIIMAVMFVICGKGGKSEPHDFLPQPWRIVTPAILFFLVMTILSIINLVIIQSGMSEFCKTFTNQLPDIGCDVAMNKYMEKPIEDMLMAPGVLHKILTSVNYISFICWLLSIIVLLARVIFVIDFQLVRVTVKTLEYENAKDSTSFQVIEEAKRSGENANLATTKC